MKLRKSEPLRIFYHHYRSVWHIYPYFHYCSRHQHLDFSPCKLFHDSILFLGLHFSMEHSNGDVWWENLSQPCCIVRHVFPVCPLAFFYHRANHIRLAPFPHLPFYKGVGFRAIRRANYTVLNRETHGRKLIYNGNIQIPVYNDRKSSGDGSGTHNQHMRRISPGSQCLSLLHAKAMLLIGDHKAKILVHHFFLDQGVSSNDHICLPGCDFSIDSSFFFLGGWASKKNRMAGWNLLFLYQFCKCFKMLICKYLCGHHQCCLIAIFHSKDHCQKSQNRFSASNVALNQPGHKGMPAKVSFDFMPGV